MWRLVLKFYLFFNYLGFLEASKVEEYKLSTYIPMIEILLNYKNKNATPSFRMALSHLLVLKTQKDLR